MFEVMGILADLHQFSFFRYILWLTPPWLHPIKFLSFIEEENVKEIIQRVTYDLV